MEVLTNETGRFFVNRAGVLTGYACAVNNRAEGWTPERQILRALHIPEGVRCVGSGMFYGITVEESLTLPASLRQISCSHAGAFARCTLPAVVLPEGLERLGIFAFGNSEIESLTLCRSLAEHPETYGRQLKGCTVGRLCVPREDSPYDVSDLPPGALRGEDVCRVVLGAKSRLPEATLRVCGDGGKLSRSRCTHSTVRPVWVNALGGVRYPEERTVVYDDDRGFLAGGCLYERLSELELVQIGDGAFRDVYGRMVLTHRERFPVFDSYDALHEKRCFRWWLFMADGQLVRIYTADGDSALWVTEDVAQLETDCADLLRQWQWIE